MRFLLILAIALAATISWQTSTLADRNPGPDVLYVVTDAAQPTEQVAKTY